MSPLNPIMQEIADTPTIDHQALNSVQEKSLALMLQFDRLEPLADPLAKFAIAINRQALIQVGAAAKSLLIFEQAVANLRAASSASNAPSKVKKPSASNANGEIIGACVNLQDKLRDLSNGIEIVRTGSSNVDVRSLCVMVLSACTRIFEAVEQARWDRLEDQADADIAAGRVKKFSRAADLLSHLSSLPS